MNVNEKLNLKTDPRGRKMSPPQMRVDRAVRRFVDQADNRNFTSRDVAKATKQNKVRVLIALRRLEKYGVVSRWGTKKNSQGRGRSAILFSK